MPNTIEEKIEELITSALGSGEVTTAAYNTAWVARIRSKNNKNVPEFPECLEFLRKSQHPDGSWGSNHPFCIFERTISTLAVVICLKQWNSSSDEQRITDGQRFLQDNLIYLKESEELQYKMPIGFEFILPSLIDEAKEMGLEFGSDDVIEIYRAEKQRKFKYIKKWNDDGNDISKVKPWYFSLEALDGLYSNEQIERLIADNGMICASYAPTAYALFKGIDSPKGLQHIRSVVAENGGGVLKVHKFPNFELSWSINVLSHSGYNIESEILQVHLNYLEEVWKKQSGIIGACKYLPPDSDTTSNTLLALSETKRVTDRESVNGLLKYLKNKYFVTHEAEKEPSLSTNLHCLLALRNFQQFEDIRQMSKEVAEWTKTLIIDNNLEFEDKWHCSPLYPMSRALIAFEFFDPIFAEKIFDLILDKQNSDGGWGLKGHSSRLETSYALISLIYWMRIHTKSIDEKSVNCLKKAKKFMKEERHEIEYNFWIGKLLYSPINLDKITILCGEYALENFESSLNSTKF